MFDVIYKGIIIGILVSAPMGPIGLLCVRRTLNKGPWHGFFSGIGAAFSDIIYAAITCVGVGIIIDFITQYQDILQIIGSALLMIYGIFVFMSNPSKSLQKSQDNVNSLSQDTITAFFLTLSNPLIIFLYIALFARFNFISADEKMYSILLGLLSILVGALCWWALISFSIGKLRKIFNVRGLWIMNKVIGLIVIGVSIAGIIYSAWEIYYR